MTIKGVDDNEDQLKLPLIFCHVYDGVEINTAVPWDELGSSTQALAKGIVDYYQMVASVKVDAHVSIRSINFKDFDPDEGLSFYIISHSRSCGR